MGIWALGVATYELLTGRLAFEGRTEAEVFENFLSGNHNLLDEPLLSPTTREFIRYLLIRDLWDRLGLKEAIQMPFLATALKESKLNSGVSQAGAKSRGNEKERSKAGGGGQEVMSRDALG